MNSSRHNTSNDDDSRLTSKSSSAVDASRVVIDVDDDNTVATFPVQDSTLYPGLSYPNCVHPSPAERLSTDQVSDRISAATAQLQATAVRLRSENQQIEAEMSRVLREITDSTFIVGKGSPNPDWCRTLTSEIEARSLRSSYDELWDRHVKSSCEITAGILSHMLQNHVNLWRHYKRMLRSHAVLEDDLQRLTRQLMTPLGPTAAPFIICLEDDDFSIVGPQVVLQALGTHQQALPQFLQAPQPTTGEGPLQTTPTMALPADHSSGHTRKRPLEQATSGISRLNGLYDARIPSTPFKRRRVGDL